MAIRPARSLPDRQTYTHDQFQGVLHGQLLWRQNTGSLDLLPLHLQKIHAPSHDTSDRWNILWKETQDGQTLLLFQMLLLPRDTNPRDYWHAEEGMDSFPGRGDSL